MEKRKKKKKQDGPNKRIQKLESQIKGLKQIMDWVSNYFHQRKVRRKSTKKESEILQKLTKWTNQKSNEEELIYVK